jgi:hypothetical protein
MAKVRGNGRPPTHSDNQLAEVLALMGSEGLTLKEAAAKRKVPYSTIKGRIAASPSLSALYARAREEYAEEMVHRMNGIAREEKDVQRARLLCDNIKWNASRVLPKQYGDKQQLEHSGDVTEPVITPNERARRLAFWLIKGVRAKEGKPI